MFKSQKNVFWQSLVITLIIFGMGVFMGVIIENWRNSRISDLYQVSEIEMLDLRLQSDLYSNKNFNCNFASQELISFADKIYEEAKLLERYEGASRLTENLIIQHKKYDLLRATLYYNVLKLNEQCELPYDVVVYFYKPDYDEPKLELKSKQLVFSRVLGELKKDKAERLLLIPIAVNKDIYSTKIILDNYKISYDSLPVLVINNSTIIFDLESKQEIDKFLK